jgi:hypothetical protein
VNDMETLVLVGHGKHDFGAHYEGTKLSRYPVESLRAHRQRVSTVDRSFGDVVMATKLQD